MNNANDNQKDCCIYCNSTLSTDKQIMYCDRCETVAFTKGFRAEYIENEIHKYIKYIKEKISTISTLHDIQQKTILGEELSHNENVIYKFCSKFQEVHSDINLYLNCSHDRKEFRNALYYLFQLSKNEEFFKTTE